jgi:acyl-CoA reductase-like NAD-dependent aldehyde dehydrogenase
MSNERVIVQRNASDALIEALSRIGQQIRVGPQETNPHIPALISEDSAKRVLNLLQDSKSRGAKMIIGDLTHQGAFLRPHIALGVQPGWPLWEQETFGPVTLIKIVDTVDEAVEFANHSDSSLMAAIWTNDTERGIRISRDIKAGGCLVIKVLVVANQNDFRSRKS